MASSETQTLSFISWNICGRKQLSQHINTFSVQHGAQIFFLQETKIAPDDKALEKVEGCKSFFTVYDSKSKGVAILIRNYVPFEYICHDEDYSGGYLVLFCHLYGELFTLVNVYNHKKDKDVLNRLQEYLRETAEGVLVVGGDFNTVLDLTFDRKAKESAKFVCHTPLKGVFTIFTEALRLRDTWGYCHSRDREFTYSQNDSFSRLDMFLICEENLERIQGTMICNSISDHSLLIIRLKIGEQFNKVHTKVPNVASWLVDHTYRGEPDRRAGKINGAEILTVIKSLTDSGQQCPDGIPVQTYKKYCSPFTEILKINYNFLMKHKQIPKDFNSFISESNGKKYFNVDYLIFTMILAKRYNMLLRVSKEKKRQTNVPDIQTYCIGFAENPKKIKWAFLKESISYLLKTFGSQENVHERDFTVLEGLVYRPLKQTSSKDLRKNWSGDYTDFQILDSFLPKVSNSSDDLRELQEGCPLKRIMLNLVLKYLEIQINEKGYKAHFSLQRHVVSVHTDNQSSFDDLLEDFRSKSGITLTISI